MPVFYKWGAGVDPNHPTIEEAHDEFLVTAEGDELIDAAAGAAVSNLGHSVPGVGEVMSAQANSVEYVSTSYFTTTPTKRLSERLEGLTPDGLDNAFYVNSGSEANEAAFKLARAYHVATGNPEKSVIIGRWQSYHGSTLGALSASGNSSRRTKYDPMLKQWDHIGPAYPYRWEYGGPPEEQARSAANELETAIRQRGPENVAAFVAEPVSGASIPAAHPHPVYYEEIRRICDEYDVLFIADEVMTGFGRTGEMFAMDHYGVVPDIMTLGKGVSAGYAPISVAMVHDDIAREFESDGDAAFGHGHTYSGHPVTTAVAAHIVDQYTDEVIETGRKRGEKLVAEIESLQEHPIVGEIRHLGLMVGIEFVADRETKTPFDPDLKVHKRIFREAMDRGVYTYPGSGSVDGVAGDHLMLTPPLTTDESSIDRIAAVVIDSIETVAAAVQ